MSHGTRPTWWLLRYPRAHGLADLIAGAVVAIMLVPQGMAYASLAGLPVQVGLYASVVPVAIYALFGSSRTLAVGPVAIVSLLVASSLAPLAAPGSPAYLALALTLAALVGLVQLALGLARAGFVVHFLSHAVLAGFTSAAALVIAISQVRHLTGAVVETDGYLLRIVADSFGASGPVSVPTMLIGAGAVLLLVFVAGPLETLLSRSAMPAVWRISIGKSGPLVAALLGIAAVALFEPANVAVVGEVPKGLPRPSWPALDSGTLGALVPAALAIAMVGFIESFAVAQSLAARRRETVDANRELVALGLANCGAAVTSGYPVTGGLSRSVVNAAAGATSGMASLVTAGLVALTLVALTPVFALLPKAVLAAVILVAVAPLVDLAALRRLWRYSRADGLAWAGTFATVLVAGVERGIVVGATIAVLLHLGRTTRPHFAIVGRVGDTEHFRNVDRHAVTTWPAVLLVRIDESLYFANAAFLESKLLAMVAARPAVRHLVLIASAVNFIDGSALERLEALRSELADAGVTLHFAEVKGPVMDRLLKTTFLDHLAPGRVFLSAHEATRALLPIAPEPPSAAELLSATEPRICLERNP